MLGLPEPRVLALLKKTWREDRKPANVLLVLDTSGSMADENRLKNAKDGLKVFLDQVAPQDRVGLTAFSEEIKPLVPVGPFSAKKARLEATIERLIADGGTAAFDAVSEGFETVQGLADRGDRINAVVLLTDGEDTDSSRTVEDVVRELEGQGDSSTQVRVFTIAYSAGARGRRGRAEADRRRLGRQQLHRQRRGHRGRVPLDQLVLLVAELEPYRRRDFAGALAANAATRPFNIAHPGRHDGCGDAGRRTWSRRCSSPRGVRDRLHAHVPRRGRGRRGARPRGAAGASS